MVIKRRIISKRPQESVPPTVIEEEPELDIEEDGVVDESADEDIEIVPKSKSLPRVSESKEKMINSLPSIPVKAMPNSVTLEEVLDALNAGKSLRLVKITANDYYVTMQEVDNVSITMKKMPAKKLSAKDYWDEVLSPDYVAFNKEWLKLNSAERVARAKKAGCEWDEHKDPKINNMRLTEAYTKKMGISKYKPEYESRAARNALRG